MPQAIRWNRPASRRRAGAWVVCALVPVAAGCGYIKKPAPYDPLAAVAMRRNRTTTAPASGNGSSTATQPAVSLSEPFSLNPKGIVQLSYELSPLVNASREAMVVGQYGLEEFKANLSRFEPFTETRGEYFEYPERRGATGRTGEVVGGMQKETFEGAVFRVEGGASGSDVEFGQVGEGQEARETGQGGLVRGRIEVPFVGSRRRQERIISQAFQESSARQAELDYLKNYRTYATQALTYYHSALLYLNYVRAYEAKIDELATLQKDPRVRPEDLSRLTISSSDSAVYRDQYQASHRDSLLTLITLLGIKPEQAYILEEPPYVESPYIAMSASHEGMQAMLEDAYSNNPTFRVLENAIKDAQLQREQAIVGQFDITAFVEGSQFPFGAETYDDRLGGWRVNSGVSVRLNDQRVLAASRYKAEAQMRKFQAQIEAERLATQRQIATETDTLRSYHALRDKIIDAIAQKNEMFRTRSTIYLEGGPAPLTIDDVLAPLSEMTAARVQLAANTYYAGLAETALMGATGEVYRQVGMEIDGGTKK